MFSSRWNLRSKFPSNFPSNFRGKFHALQSLFQFGLVILAVPFFVPSARGSNEVQKTSKPLESQNKSMNGIRFEDFRDFENKWKLITVRYRSDSGEQRFTYANSKALRALRSGSRDYPDGAVFAKAAFKTEEDPAFSNSKTPSGTVRYQFMVRNKRKYAETGGWGYALFNPEGFLIDTNVPSASQACYACHRLVPDRGEVFSQEMSWHPLTPRASMPANSRLQFIDRAVLDLPESVRSLFKKEVKTVRALTGEIQKNIFQGTIDETRLPLTFEAERSGLPVILISDDRRQFSLVLPADMAVSNSENRCSGKKFFRTFSTARLPNDTQFTVVERPICLEKSQ